MASKNINRSQLMTSRTSERPRRADPVDYPPMRSTTAAVVIKVVATAKDECSIRAETDPLVVLASSVGVESGDEGLAAIGDAPGMGAGVPVHPHVKEMSASVASVYEPVPFKSPVPKQHRTVVGAIRDLRRL